MIVNCAALTDVDGAESNEREAMAINDTGAGLLAVAAGTVGAKVVYPSSDYVFDGHKGHPYMESDMPHPLSAYGRTKLAGETSVAVANTRHLIVRTSWLFGVGGKNFVETMLRIGGEQEEVLVVSDQVGAPTYTPHLAGAMALLAESEDYGVHHVTASGSCSWFEFAQEIFDQAGLGTRVMAAPDLDARPPGSPPCLLGARERVVAADGPAALARRPGRVHERARDGGRGDRGCRMKVLVTGGAGFIGSAYVRRRLEADPVGLGAGAGQAHLRRPAARTSRGSERCELVVGDIAEPDIVRDAIEGCDALVNFAAESHVDRSIEEPGEFIRTDVFGTFVLLEAAREAGIRHLQVSTDEVYGSIESGSFTESSPLDPSSPYSASKAGGDLIVSAFHHTYGAEALIVRASNNYGPRQHPEKLIPLCILNALAGDELPVYGDGMQVRNWLHVTDFASAIDLALERGEPGRVYNVGGPDELPNIEVVKRILELAGRDESLITHVEDRLGHDRRYSLSADRISEELGWQAVVRFDEGIADTVAWYRDNEDWWAPIRSGEYREYYERQYGRALG